MTMLASKNTTPKNTQSTTIMKNKIINNHINNNSSPKNPSLLVLIVFLAGYMFGKITDQRIYDLYDLQNSIQIQIEVEVAGSDQTQAQTQAQTQDLLNAPILRHGEQNEQDEKPPIKKEQLTTTVTKSKARLKALRVAAANRTSTIATATAAAATVTVTTTAKSEAAATIPQSQIRTARTTADMASLSVPNNAANKTNQATLVTTSTITKRISTIKTNNRTASSTNIAAAATTTTTTTTTTAPNNNNKTDTDTDTTKNNATEMIVVNPIAGAYSRSSLNFSDIDHLPPWYLDYFAWHHEQVNSEEWLNTSTSFKVKNDFRYLVMRCTHKDGRCGGTSDRLKPLPFFLRVAYDTQRIFLIRWHRPCRLEEFLMPNILNWSIPEPLENQVFVSKTSYQNVVQPSGFSLYGKKRRIRTVEGKVQVNSGGAWDYSKLIEDKVHDTYHNVFHDVFRALFVPSPPVKALIDAKMNLYGLQPGQYTISHYRAFYSVENKKEVVSPEQLRKRAINAVNCASQLYPRHPIYFASDSNVALEQVQLYAQEKALAASSSSVSSLASSRKIVSVPNTQEALHLDFASRADDGTMPNPADFYDTFVDLWIMGNGKCVGYGAGGFGKFASLLSYDSSCMAQFKKDCEWKDH